MSQCIEWQRGKDGKGYGSEYRDGKSHLAHRLAYCDHHGLALEDIAGKVVRHTCDNPPCVNADHLLLGTHADNAQDRQERGRGGDVKGTRHGMAKLTDEDVLAIRSEYVAGCRENGGNTLSRRYGVSSSRISRIVNRLEWTHI